jgi:hypothetical protein
MQEQGILVMLFVMFVMPMVLLFSNHDTFFIVIALILFISSAVSLKSKIFGKKVPMPSNEETELLDDVEEYVNLDLEKFGTGTKVFRHSIALIFFVYSSFYVESILFRVLIALVLVFWVYKILEDVLADGSPLLPVISPLLKDFLTIFTSAATLLIIIAVALNKFTGLKI